jgi:hypothetical protein
MTAYPDGDTLQALAAYLAAKSGKTVRQQWEHAIAISYTAYETKVLALDEDGKVVNLGRVENVYRINA